ncbi:Inosine-5'-monophosphate dehydrogenase [Rhodovulum sp. PH10]|uniref:CBS domain-containing protein n=1 Tax=Rhodovulum sp. PH10 TaxID=1187851 RepID=UPI00027C207E|nr:CBS domain-containing protein [Rhodovulum sp. PH10]EJW10363.1 Inosine-5'-monophosphate dehydrogenase [Rhodovulum sp. PH10]
MKASDLMTSEVVTVAPHVPVRKIAEVLHRNGISAVPVVDDRGALIGIVSEGDLIPLSAPDRNERRDWWLRMLAEGEELGAAFVEHLEKDQRTAREIMKSPVITVPAEADLVEVAQVLASHHIRRAPVMANGRMVGIVSRADLVEAIAENGRVPAAASEQKAPGGFDAAAAAQHLTALQERLKKKALASNKTSASAPSHAAGPAQPVPAAQKPAGQKPASTPTADAPSAAEFRHLVEQHEQDVSSQHGEAHRQLEERRRQEVNELLATDLDDERWQRLVHEAQIAAEKGEAEHMLIRFPCDLCSDHGRAVNAPDPNWPETLRGLPAKIFARWKEELQPHGFVMHARVVDFPDGMPGDVGLFLAWGK